MFITVTDYFGSKLIVNTDDISSFLQSDDKTEIQWKSDRANTLIQESSELVGYAVNSVKVYCETYKVVLSAYPKNNKIKVIKRIRQFLSLGLKEAKDLSESLPAILETSCNLEKAKEIAESFDGIGTVYTYRNEK